MKIGIICGSQRRNSQTVRIGRYVESVIQKQLGIQTYFLELAETKLPWVDEDYFAGKGDRFPLWKETSQHVESCDGFVVLSPEWGGMVPPVLKNFFLLCTRGQLYHKPGMIMTIVSGIAGCYPVAELRAFSTKNNFLCFTPEHVVIRYVETMMKEEAPASPQDTDLRERTLYSIKVLYEYAKALKQVRESGVLQPKKYPNGM